MSSDEDESSTSMEVAQPKDVSATLKKVKAKLQSAHVSKDDDLVYDLGNLYAFDAHPVDIAQLNANTPDYLKATARDNVQLLVAKLFVLPTQRIDNAGVLASLPAPTLRIPREKPVPHSKALTKWEQYAQLKGIHKKKKGRMVFDEDFGEYRPRWGYKRANNTLDKGNWVIEHKGTSMTAEDPFLQAAQEKQGRVAKQKKQEVRNKKAALSAQNKSTSAALTTDVSSVIRVTPGDERRTRERKLIEGTLGKTRHSTASLGRFDPLLNNEKPMKAPRQKYDPVEKSASEETARNVKMLDRIMTTQEGGLNVDKAIKHTKGKGRGKGRGK